MVFGCNTALPPDRLLKRLALPVPGRYGHCRMARMATTPESLGDPMADRRGRRAALRIVVADDDRDTVETLAAVLRDEGHLVYCVYSGKEVLPTVRSVRPDAVVLDIAVPGMSGYAVAQEIRYSFIDMRRPVLIAISGVWKEHSDQILARQVGFDAHLVKPCEPADVLALLRRLTLPGSPRGAG